MSQLKETVFRWFPAETCPLDAKVIGTSGSWADRYGYADFKDFSIQVEDQVRIRAQLHPPKGRADAPLLVYVRRLLDTGAISFVDEFLPLMSQYAILVLNPRFSGQTMTPAEYADMERSSTFVGRTIASMQVWDVLRAVDWAVREQKVSTSRLALYGKGEMGIVCLYAGLFDDRIQQVILNDAPGSHWQGPALLNVLRVTDIPETAAAFAPRRLVSLTQLPDSFTITQSIYGLEQASKKLVQAGSLPEAMEVWKQPINSRASGRAPQRTAP
jgi:hypothetical protein